jgi:histidinol-phosphate aminotransferase
MSNSIHDQFVSIASHLKSLPAYTPIEPFEVVSRRLNRRPDEIIKLDANENPYGPSPRARQSLANLPFPHIYPDPESRLLRTALSDFTSVPIENLLAGAGADELIDLVLRVLLEPGDRVMICPPTFGMYAFDTHINAGQIIEVPRQQDFSLDLNLIHERVKTQTPKVLFLTSPNNPDGSILDPTEFAELITLPTVLVLDEAYIEFSGFGSLGELATRITQVPDSNNLIVLRSFSKWAALAGLRVGYGAFPDWLMPILWKTKQPYNVNVAASAAAIASLEDHQYLSDTVSMLRSERDRLFSALQGIPFLSPYPSFSNFILCKVVGNDAATLKRRLAEEFGILVRYFNSPGLQDHIRISVGKPEHTDALLQALVSC